MYDASQRLQESDRALQRTAASESALLGANITRAAPHFQSRQNRAQRGPAGEHAVRFSAQPPARTRRPFCSFESVSLEPAMPFEATERHCTQRYTVQFPNSHTAILTAHALLTVWHAALRRPRPLSPPAEPIPSVWQHCLVDCTQRSSTLWRKARLMKHIARVKYGGILAVAYDERRRLLIDRTIRKWRNSALRYRAVSMWRYDFPRPCVRAEACGLPAAEHSQLGCST